MNESILNNVLQSTIYPTLGEYRKIEPSTITVECTNEMEYLRQYFFIREYIYTRDLHLKSFSGGEDETDSYSQFIITRKGKFCFGGSRLTISTADNRQSLPLEGHDFCILENFPSLENMNFCELGRTAILPNYRNGDHLNKMFSLSAKIAKSNNCKILFGASPAAVARRFRGAFNNLGYPTVIHKNISPPTKKIHEGLGLRLLIINLAPDEIDVEKFSYQVDASYSHIN